MTKGPSLNELNDQCRALCSWFESQGINTTNAVMLMGYTLGVLAATTAKDKSRIAPMIESVSALAHYTATESYGLKD